MRLAPAFQRGGLPAHRGGTGGNATRVWSAHEIALGERGAGVPGRFGSALDDLLSDAPVSFAEGHARADQFFRRVGGQQAGIARSGSELLAVEREVLDQEGRRGQGIKGAVDGGEERGLVFLQIAVVGKRQPLQNAGQRDQAAEGAARTAPQKLCDVGVLLLRHEAGAGRDLVDQPHKAELRAGP